MKSESQPAKTSSCPQGAAALPSFRTTNNFVQKTRDTRDTRGETPPAKGGISGAVNSERENGLKIIHEDNHIIVVIKPQNVPCCPDDSGDPNLLDQIKDYIKTASAKTGEAFCGLVHRLDRVTGGVMVFAKTSKAAVRLSAQIAPAEINPTVTYGDTAIEKGGISAAEIRDDIPVFQKRYLAVVLGEPKQREQTLVNYLLKNEIKNTVSVVPPATSGAKRAELVYKVLNIKNGGTPNCVSLVDIKLLTGRSHQIRVQMSNMGNPVFGDAKYGGDRLGKGWNIALWAHEIRFTHPTTGDIMRFTVGPPEATPWTSFDFDRKSHKTRT